MELEHIKSNWSQLGKNIKNQSELVAMTKVKNHPKIKRIRLKFIIETLAIAIFLAIYYDGFDGIKKPVWSNVFLVISILFYLLVRIRGLYILRNPIKEGSLKSSLLRFKQELKQLTIATLLSSFLFGAAVIVFFISVVEINQEKSLILILIIALLVVFMLISGLNWQKKRKTIEATLLDFEASST